MKHILRPTYFFIGLCLGFSFCCLAGYFISKSARLNNFKRFYYSIQPQGQYFPTPNEVLETAKHAIRSDKIIVLIGGSSVLRGLGQNSNELWSDELQKLLGKKFKVLNFAIDHAAASSFGIILFKMLIKRFPKIIYVSDCVPGRTSPIDGIDEFNYFFWDAYYKNLIYLEKEESKIIHQLQREQLATVQGAEKHIQSILNYFFNFKSLWNWVSYRYFFTVWSHEARLRVLGNLPTFQSRHAFLDIDTDMKIAKANLEKNSTFLTMTLETIQKTIDENINFSNSQPQYKPEMLALNCQFYNDIFPVSARSKILCIVLHSNSAYIKQLPRQYLEGSNVYVNQFCTKLKEMGINFTGLETNLLPEDYLDHGHLMSSGAKKVAQDTAKKVRALAMANGYL